MKQNLLKLFLEDESGVTVIEIVLILVVLIGLVIIFKNQLNSLIQYIFEYISLVIFCIFLVFFCV